MSRRQDAFRPRAGHLLRWKHPACRTGFAAASLLLTIALALTFSRSGVQIFFAELALFGLPPRGEKLEDSVGRCGER